MNISLEEQIEYMREEIRCTLAESSTRAMLKAILATLESMKEQKGKEMYITVLDNGGIAVGKIKVPDPENVANEWGEPLAPTKPE